MYLKQQERLHLRCQIKLTTYIPSFPTCLSHLGSVPLLFSTVLWLLDFLSGLQQQAEQEVSEQCSCSLAPSGNQFPTILSPREFLMGLTTHFLQYPMGLTTRFFSPAPKLTRYTRRYGYGYRFRYIDMKVQRIAP